MTIYIQTHEGPDAPAKFPPDLWEPWRNCVSMEETIQLALHRYIRERGGVIPSEKLVVVRVLAVPEEDMRATHGRPKTAFCTVFNVRPN